MKYTVDRASRAKRKTELPPCEGAFVNDSGEWQIDSTIEDLVKQHGSCIVTLITEGHFHVTIYDDWVEA